MPTKQASLLSYVNNVWLQMKHKRSLVGANMSFFPVKKLEELSFDSIIGAYMKIGEINVTTPVSAVIGQYQQSLSVAVEKFGVPYFVIGHTGDENTLYNVIYVSPRPKDLYRIAVDLVLKYGWRSLAIFYEGSDGAALVEALVGQPDVRVRSWKIDISVKADKHREILLYIRRTGETNILVIASRYLTNIVLEEALRLSMLSSRFSWILPSLTNDIRDLMKYSFTGVNLTTFHLIGTDTSIPLSPVDEFSYFEYVTVYDSLLTLYEGVLLHYRNTRNCVWANKQYLHSTLSLVSAEGATGHLDFKRDGTRQGYIVDIESLTQNGSYKIGSWNSSAPDPKRLVIDYGKLREDTSPEYPMGKSIVPIVTILEAPFVQLKEDHDKRKGNDKYEGYCIDLLAEIAKHIAFEYKLYLVPDKQFGSADAKTGEWNGIIGEILNGNASLAIASLSITAQREEVIDFTKPFKNVGVTIAMRRPAEKRSFFHFLAPLSTMIWILLICVILSISFVLYVIDKMSPSMDPTIRFDIQNSVWFTFSSMVLNSSDLVPKTISGRILAGVLWFFALMILSTYTANLAAFLTISKFETPIKSVYDLLSQTKITYGTVGNSDVSEMFERSKLEHFKQMWHYMSTMHPETIVSTSEDGFAKVKTSEGSYVFMWDSPVVKHKTAIDCDITEVGEPFGSKGYGIGMPRGAQYRDLLTMAILKLNEDGVLSRLEHTWWGRNQCPDVESPTTNNSEELSLERIGGMFIIIAAGAILAIISATIEYLYYRCTKGKTKKPKRTLGNTSDVSSNSLDKAYDVHINSHMQADEPFLPRPIYQESRSRMQTHIF